jgi:hypothetical protein
MGFWVTNPLGVYWWITPCRSSNNAAAHVGVAIAPLRVLGLSPSRAWLGQQWRDYAHSFLKVLQLIKIHLLGLKLFFVGAPRLGAGLIW